MERLLQTPAVDSSSADGCIACGASVHGPRCTHCGVAVAPGGFRVRRVISERPHGRMYLAQDASDRRVALKELLFALVPTIQELEGFEREAHILRALSHPHIPRFIQSFSEGTGTGTRLYLAHEFVEGESLLERLLRQPLDEAEAWNIAEQLLAILAHLHSRTPALIHRD